MLIMSLVHKIYPDHGLLQVLCSCKLPLQVNLYHKIYTICSIWWVDPNVMHMHSIQPDMFHNTICLSFHHIEGKKNHPHPHVYMICKNKK